MADSELFSSIYSLEYPLLYPKYNWPKDQDKFHSLRFLIATKSNEWEYEDEIRVVKDRHNTPFFRGKVRFDKKALVSLRFGYKCTLNDINEIKQVLDYSKDYNHVKLYKAVLKEQEFGISYMELTGGNLLDQ